MKAIHQGILLLIKSAITGEKYPLPRGFSMEEALDVIKRHNIIPLAYDGAVRCGVRKDTPAMQQLFLGYCRIMMHCEGQMYAIGEICRAFDENAIDYMPLKGCKLKKMYPKPELRQMGDADILIKKDQYGLIRPILREKGFEEVMESDHELVWKRKDLHLELHKRLIPSYNKDYYAYFGDGWRLAKLSSGSRYDMSPEDEFIFVFTHFAKHYRDGGIGLRHVLDLWVYRRNCPCLNDIYIFEAMNKLCLAEFYENIRALIDAWFNDGQENDKTAFIGDFIFDSGNWGKWENHAFSEAAKNSDEKAGNIRAKMFLKAAFPSAKTISTRFHILERAPVLLPFCWIIRWADALLFRRDKIQDRRRDQKIVSSEKVTSYRSALRYVGLDFNFNEQKEKR